MALAGVLMGSTLGSAFAEEVSIALASNFQSLDPHTPSVVGTELNIVSHIYSPLILMGPNIDLQPALAESWTAIEPTVWQFVLREGITFPSGEAVTSDVIKWNFERLRNPETKASWAPRYAPIERIDIVDDRTFNMVTTAPFPALPAQMTMFFIMSPEWAASHNPVTEASGTGPYELVEFVPGSHVQLKARADYFGEKPAFEDAVFRIIPEPAARIAGLMTGELDLIVGFPTSEIERLTANENVAAGSIPSNRVNLVRFNTDIAPFHDNHKIRLALNYAVDKQAILDGVWGGGSTISNCQLINKNYFGYNPDLQPIPYDPEKARALLAEAGYPNGLSLDFQVPRGRYLQGEEISQVIASYLEAVGITVNIIEHEFSTYMQMSLNRQMPQMAYSGIAWPTWDADGQLTAMQPGKDAFSYYDSAEFGRVMDLARVEPDVEKRKALYKEATEVMCADPVGIFLFDQPLTYAHSKRISWQARGDDFLRAYDMAPAQ